MATDDDEDDKDKCEVCGAQLESDSRETACGECLRHMEPDPDEAYEFARELRYSDND